MDKLETDQNMSTDAQKCVRKPVEIYLFTDSLCRDCWALEPLIQKLSLQYGHYFTLRHVLTGKMEAAAASPSYKWTKPAHVSFVWEKTSSLHGLSCDGKINMHRSDASPYSASLAVKAAELQGRKAGSRYLRRLQESMFLQHVTNYNYDTLTACAQKSGIDVQEFRKDVHSISAKKAFQCDLKFANEMHITEVPSLIFFDANSDEEGIKISGLYPYEVYVQVLKEMLKQSLSPNQLPPLEKLFEMNDFTHAAEIGYIYSLTHAEVMREVNQLLLTRKIVNVISEKETYWEYAK